jgi:1,4-dihydroxy-6-naphthoate synthase
MSAPLRTLSLGFSPCPNDTFIFHALVHGLVQVPGLAFSPRLEDVETLNRLAAKGALELSKVSYGAIPHLIRDYVLLRSGGALGRGCGPLVVARTPLETLAGRRVAIPGRNTTAWLLLRLFAGQRVQPVEMVYSEIMPAVERGEVDAGLIIHESRFTYPAHGLVQVVDLGEWWERTTGLPIPLGGILARRDLGEETIRAVDSALRASVAHAFAAPEDSREYVRANAQEMDEAVQRQHIALYVNEFSEEVGDAGEAAIRELFHRARAAAVIDQDVTDPFL